MLIKLISYNTERINEQYMDYIIHAPRDIIYYEGDVNDRERKRKER